MVLGDHGRKVLTPLTVTQSFARFPWAKFYKNSLYFRAMCGTGVVVASAWAYIILKGKFWREFAGYFVWLGKRFNLILSLCGPGIDVSFTPYDAVHHSIGHKFAHDLEHLRYPIDHHHDDKAAKKH